MVPTPGGSVLCVCTKFEADCSFRSKVIRVLKFRPAADPFPGARDGQNLISWRWSLPLPINPVW